MSRENTERERGKERPLASIVTPSYNQGRFIKETILSVKNQDYPNIEHIIVDGGSTDNTLEILKKYEGTYNMRWICEPDEGMYQAINKGLSMAQGAIMSYLNSDDLYLPWTISTVTAYLQDHPDVDLIYGDMVVLTLNGKLGLRHYPPFNLEYIQRTGFLGQPTVFWRRQVFDQLGGFDEALKFVGDCDYWMKAGSAFIIKKINEFLAIERAHPQTKRFTKRDSLRKELQRVRTRYCDLVSIQGRVRRIWDRTWAFFWQRYYMVRFLYLYYKRSSDALKHPAWSDTLNTADFRLAPLNELLLGFLPKGRSRWVVSDASLLPSFKHNGTGS